MSREFWFVYATPVYDATVAFLRDGLGFAVADSWDRGRDHRGTIFVARSDQANPTSSAAAAGLIEVLENAALSAITHALSKIEKERLAHSKGGLWLITGPGEETLDRYL